MFKELIKRWFRKTSANNRQEMNLHRFESVEEARDYINRIKANRTNRQIAKYLNRRGYRTVRGYLFTVQSVYYYMKDDNNLNKARANNSNYYWNKKKNSKGVTA